MTREEAWRRTKGYLYDVLSGEEADEIIKALEQEPKTDGDCIRKKDDEAIEKKLKLAGYEKVVTCAECVHGVEVGLGLYKCLDCDWIGDDDFWCKEGERREE